MDKKLAKASFDITPIGNTYPTYYLPGLQSTVGDTRASYHDTITKCRYFYEYDTIAGGVIDRMCDISITSVKNKHRKYSNEIKWYYDGIARQLSTLLKAMPLSYLIDGMVIPEYKTDKIMGNRIHQSLGRTRYIIPKSVWLRNAMHIELKKAPQGNRVLYLRVPQEDIIFIETKGEPDRVEEYKELVRLYPEYINAVNKGARLFKLNVSPIFRKLTSYNTYPTPYLKKVLGALDYRKSLKRMDKITSERVIQALRQVKIGSDEYPADDDDITAAKTAIQSQTAASGQDSLINVYTNHTIAISWIVPPIESILSKDKYDEAVSDIMKGLGFPRLWLVGENERSNSSDNKLAATGPIAALDSMRMDILEWVRILYADLAELNGFTQYPDPYWQPINTASIQDLLQYGSTFLQEKVISKNTAANLYGSDYDTEHDQIEYEQSQEPKEETPNEDNIPEQEFGNR